MQVKVSTRTRFIHKVILLFCFIPVLNRAQDSTFLKVHFLYGSKPLKKYKDTEGKWFGGILGGHVGIEGDNNSIVNFVPNGKFHWFSKKEDKHSTFTTHSDKGFYSIFGGNPDSVKKAVVYIPVTQQQKQKFDSITAVYLNQTPYDYAFFGMRCSAAAHDILGQIGIMPDYSKGKTCRKIFYPRKLRKRVFKKAKENSWIVERQEGTPRRKWEGDRG